MTLMKCLECDQLLTDDNSKFLTDEHSKCPPSPAPDAKPTDLELIVVDFGDSCVVRVEKGFVELLIGGYRIAIGPQGSEPTVIARQFDQVRKAIEGDKPVPRIEEESGGAWRLHFNNQQIEPQQTYIGPNARAALETLFGKPLPIYTGGTWEQLNTHDWTQAKKDAGEAGYGIDAFSFEETICPVKIWKYTR